MSEALGSEIAFATRNVAIAFVPLAVLFLIFQQFLLKLPREQVTDILTGSIMAAVGLFLFLLGIGIGFLPFGRAIGATLSSLNQTWLFVVIGMLLGFLTTWGEPSVRVLVDQIEDASSGSIRKPMVLNAICIGVALWVGIGVIKIIYGIPLLYFLVPGYILVIGLIWLSDKDFVAIAVDASGVATGPLANSFLLALGLGASASMGDQEPIIHGFGLVALIAVAPLFSVMMLGVLVQLRTCGKE